MIDPEDLRDRRREPQPKTPTTSSAVSALDRTAEMLARLRADDATADGRRWLARHRSDRHSLERIAADEGRSVTEIHAGIEKAKALETR